MPGIKSKHLLEKNIVLNSAPWCITWKFINIYGSFKTVLTEILAQWEFTQLEIRGLKSF